MGVGKTAAATRVAAALPHSVFLDGDWCWQLNPFEPTAEDREMVLRNIAFLLESFAHNPRIRTIVFCWVLHEQWIIDRLASALTTPHRLHSFSLVATPDALVSRHEADIIAGLRQPGGVAAALDRLARFNGVDSVRIDTTALSADEVAQRILDELHARSGRTA